MNVYDDDTVCPSAETIWYVTVYVPAEPSATGALSFVSAAVAHPVSKWRVPESGPVTVSRFVEPLPDRSSTRSLKVSDTDSSRDVTVESADGSLPTR